MKTEVFETGQREYPGSLQQRREEDYPLVAANQDSSRADIQSAARGRWLGRRWTVKDGPSDAAVPIGEAVRPPVGGMVLIWSINRLRPTQMTVGFREVAEKRRRWRSSGSLRLGLTLGRTAPVVIGPGQAPYALDRHHTLCALIAEGVNEVPITVVGDLSDLGADAFWRTLIHRRWCHPFDAEGVRQPWQAIPRRLIELADDPFRSLASALRRSGGYAKTSGLFSEFQWAAYLRQHISSKRIGADFSGALRTARSLANQPAAKSLPGWRRAPASAADAT